MPEREYEAIVMQIAGFAAAADRREWTAAQSHFADSVLVDYESLSGQKPRIVTVAELIEGWQTLLPGFTRTHHLIGLPFIRRAGPSLSAEAPLIAHHFLNDPMPEEGNLWIVGGVYHFEFSETALRITSLSLREAWQEGNLDLPRLAAARVVSSRG
jgi:hypothetical protein